MTPEDKRPLLLVVDDAVDNIAVLGAALRGDYEIIFATSGPQALDMAARQPNVELILLDVTMPGMDGYEVCRQLKAAEQTQSIPIIFLTARDDEQDEVAGFAAGAVDYITKPFRAPLVKARVRTHIDLKRKTDVLERLALLDGLTGISNRRRFDQTLATEWRRAMRSGDSLGLLMVDVDHFKLYNDHYGHLAGDDCLRAVATCLETTLSRAGDLVARLGGEEFAAVLPRSDLKASQLAGQRLQKAFEKLALPHAASPVAPHITLSMGAAAMCPTNAMQPAALVDLADRALYHAKAGGRNRVYVGL